MLPHPRASGKKGRAKKEWGNKQPTGVKRRGKRAAQCWDMERRERAWNYFLV